MKIRKSTTHQNSESEGKEPWSWRHIVNIRNMNKEFCLLCFWRSIISWKISLFLNINSWQNWKVWWKIAFESWINSDLWRLHPPKLTFRALFRIQIIKRIYKWKMLKRTWNITWLMQKCHFLQMNCLSDAPPWRFS